jgi:hypothetical protein
MTVPTMPYQRPRERHRADEPTTTPTGTNTGTGTDIGGALASPRHPDTAKPAGATTRAAATAADSAPRDLQDDSAARPRDHRFIADRLNPAPYGPRSRPPTPTDLLGKVVAAA